MPTLKLCLMFNRYESCFILLVLQAELGNSCVGRVGAFPTQHLPRNVGLQKDATQPTISISTQIIEAIYGLQRSLAYH
jgi:hypothetical protein